MWASLQDGPLIGTWALQNLVVDLSVVAGHHHGEVFNRIIPHLHIVGNGALKERNILIDH